MGSTGIRASGPSSVSSREKELKELRELRNELKERQERGIRNPNMVALLCQECIADGGPAELLPQSKQVSFLCRTYNPCVLF